MGFFKNINATPRTGSVIMHHDGFSIYTDNGWQNYNMEYFREYIEKDISDNTEEYIYVPTPKMMIF